MRGHWAGGATRRFNRHWQSNIVKWLFKMDKLKDAGLSIIMKKTNDILSFRMNKGEDNMYITRGNEVELKVDYEDGYYLYTTDKTIIVNNGGDELKELYDYDQKLSTSKDRFLAFAVQSAYIPQIPKDSQMRRSGALPFCQSDIPGISPRPASDYLELASGRSIQRKIYNKHFAGTLDAEQAQKGNIEYIGSPYFQGGVITGGSASGEFISYTKVELNLDLETDWTSLKIGDIAGSMRLTLMIGDSKFEDSTSKLIPEIGVTYIASQGGSINYERSFVNFVTPYISDSQGNPVDLKME